MKDILNDEQKKIVTKLVESRSRAIIRFYMEKKDLSEKDKYDNTDNVLRLATNDSVNTEKYMTYMVDLNSRMNNKDKLLPLSTIADIRFYQAVYELWAFYNGKDKCLDILGQRFSNKPVNNEQLEAIRDFSRKVISEFNNRRSLTTPLAYETKENIKITEFSPPNSYSKQSYVNLVNKQREEESKENNQPPLGYAR